MNLKRIAVALLFCLAPTARAHAQTGQPTTIAIEYGDLSELAGKRRVFVHAADLNARDRIVKELLKASQLGLEVVGRAEDADFILSYDAGIALTGPNAFADSAADVGGEATAAGDMVAYRPVSGEAGGAVRTRILWHAHKRQSLIRTDQFFRETYSDNTRSNLISLGVSGLINIFPRLSVIPVGKSPEVKATREFLKALKETYGRQAARAQQSALLFSDASPRVANPAPVEEWPRMQLPSPVLAPLGEETSNTARLLPILTTRPRALHPRGGRRAHRGRVKARRRAGRVNKARLPRTH